MWRRYLVVESQPLNTTNATSPTSVLALRSASDQITSLLPAEQPAPPPPPPPPNQIQPVQSLNRQCPPHNNLHQQQGKGRNKWPPSSPSSPPPPSPSASRSCRPPPSRRSGARAGPSTWTSARCSRCCSTRATRRTRGCRSPGWCGAGPS